MSGTVIEQSIFYPFSALSLSLSAYLCKEEEKCERVTSADVFFIFYLVLFE